MNGVIRGGSNASPKVSYFRSGYRNGGYGVGFVNVVVGFRCGWCRKGLLL